MHTNHRRKKGRHNPRHAGGGWSHKEHISQIDLRIFWGTVRSAERLWFKCADWDRELSGHHHQQLLWR